MTPAARHHLHVVRPGALTTVQDAGRPGRAHLGVGRAGALDAPAARLANRLVGNPPDAAVLETTLTGCAVRPDRPVVAVVGGAGCRVTVDGRPVAWGAPVRVPAGAVLDAGPAGTGLRSYLAFAGGLVPDPVLGSRSADLLSGLGPAPLSEGDELPLGDPASGGPPPHAGPVPWPGAPAELVLPVHPGPRHDWFTEAALRTLLTAAYRVSPHSNRIGLRTEGPPLERSRTEELPSEGMVLGAIQVPPDGRPVVFLNDHPTTGGYPVVGVVPERALAAAAQAVPGTRLRFVRA
ncbi:MULTISPECIES: biotin-dependent carboxyltransferase family protein [Streptomyces]|uniref:5-oxoprolinase subunit C family protein n=1 Tax=Streptomyces TaxID=1883 RepID=UPI001FABCF38|nr:MULTISPECIES: biotin-dependent carboxyltransferase family protein [Streptomyces]MDX2920866.1 biotin-dependent carboxyltransferase family protein [Streptomyces sp. NE06-03C]MDX3609050.1 biotin-dependent carboxyltransferase family protein [Streptomyces sp. FL06-04B]MDX3740084.1 biotin-dependent carboxyltransferase family protein [Streptomyces sp. ID01-15D]